MDLWLLEGAIVAALFGAYFDVVSARIPNTLTYSALLCGLLVRGAFLGWRGLWDGIAGVLLCGGLFLLLFMIHAMGGGDVKMMAAVGAWIGWQKSGTALIVCTVIGGLIALGYVIVLKRYRDTATNVISLIRFHATRGAQPNPELNLSTPGAVRMPYGVAIAAGAVGTLVSTVWKN